jgi:spore germination protein GerM
VTRTAKVILSLLGVLAVALSAAGCGIPTEATARPIDPDVLPPSLVEQATTTTAPTSGGGRRVPVELFLVSSKGDTQKLSAVDADIVNVVDMADLPRQVIEQLITQQATTGSDGSDLTNTIPPDTQVLDANMDGTVLDLDLSALGRVESTRQRLAVAQIVYTATALDTVTGVRFWIDGEPASVSLEDHASEVGQVITPRDYPNLVSR